MVWAAAIKAASASFPLYTVRNRAGRDLEAENAMTGGNGMESTMSDSPSLIMIQFLAWVADRPRTRDQAMEAWHSCPHISAWEDAIVDGLVRIDNDGSRTVSLTPRGCAVLEKAQAHAL